MTIIDLSNISLYRIRSLSERSYECFILAASHDDAVQKFKEQFEYPLTSLTVQALGSAVDLVFGLEVWRDANV